MHDAYRSYIYIERAFELIENSASTRESGVKFQIYVNTLRYKFARTNAPVIYEICQGHENVYLIDSIYECDRK